MALIKCKECGNQVSLKASACQKCGAPPPSPEELRERTKNSILGWGVIIGLGLVVFVGISVKKAFDSNGAEGTKLEYLSTPEEERLFETRSMEYFAAHREKILSEMRTLMSQQSYSEALALGGRYDSMKDGELLAMVKNAEQESLLAEVKKVPAKEFEKNKEIYAKLVSLNPKEPLYKQKHDYYQAAWTQQEQNRKRLEANREKEKKRVASKFGRAPIVGPGFFGYACPEIKIYLQETANDPDSIELVKCTDVKMTQQGWLVGCVYRGRNGFGGMVKNANWFTIRHEQVVKVDPSSTYSWQ